MRPSAARGSATVLAMVAVVVAGAMAVAAGRSAEVVTARRRAATVAESVVCAVAADRVRGLDAPAAIARGRALAARNGVTVTRLVETGEHLEVRVERDGAIGTARARLEW